MARSLDLIPGAQAAEHLADAYVVLLPLGSCEYHGPHAPLGTDAIISSELVKRTADKLEKQGFKAAVIPTIPFGYSILHERFPGTISLRNETLRAILDDVFDALLRNGVKFMMIVNGHDGNAPSIDVSSYSCRMKSADMLIAACTYWDLTRGNPEVDRLYEEDVFKGKGHGGAEETALVMAARPGAVDLSQAADGPVDKALLDLVGQPRPFLYHGVEVFLSTEEWAPLGFDGDARIATAEKGEKDYDYTVDALIELIHAIRRTRFFQTQAR